MTKSSLYTAAILAVASACAAAENSSVPTFDPIISMGGESQNWTVSLPPVATLGRPNRGEGLGNESTFNLDLGNVIASIGDVESVQPDPEPEEPAPVEPVMPEPEEPAPVEPVMPEPEEPAPAEPEPVEPAPHPEEPAAPAPVISNAAVDAAVFTTVFDRAAALRSVVRQDNVNGHNLWVVAEGSHTRLTDNRHAKTNAYGVTAGVDTTVNGYTFGLAMTTGTGNTYAARKDDFTWYGASVYGKTTMNGFGIIADASFVTLKSDVSNAARVTTNVTSMGIEVTKDFAIASAIVTPFIGFDAYHLESKGFGTAETSVEKSSATAVELPIGAKVAATLKTANGMKVTPTFKLAAVTSVADKAVESKAVVSNGSRTFTTNFTDNVRVRSEVTVKLEKGNFGLNLNASYERGNKDRASTSYVAKACYAF